MSHPCQSTLPDLSEDTDSAQSSSTLSMPFLSSLLTFLNNQILAAPQTMDSHRITEGTDQTDMDDIDPATLEEVIRVVDEAIRVSRGSFFPGGEEEMEERNAAGHDQHDEEDNHRSQSNP